MTRYPKTCGFAQTVAFCLAYYFCAEKRKIDRAERTAIKNKNQL